MHAMASQRLRNRGRPVRGDYKGEAGRAGPASSPVPLRSPRCVMIRAALQRKVLS